MRRYARQGRSLSSDAIANLTILVLGLLLLVLVGYAVRGKTLSLPDVEWSVVREWVRAVAFVVGWVPFIGAPVLYVLRSVHKVCAWRQVVYWLLCMSLPSSFAHVAVLGLLIGEPGLSVGYLCLLVGIGLPWYWLTRWPARWLAPRIIALFVQQVRCAHCHELYPLRSRWQCGCGYVDHRSDRHLLWFSCPKCQASIGWIDCARCETTIVL